MNTDEIIEYLDACNIVYKSDSKLRHIRYTYTLSPDLRMSSSTWAIAKTPEDKFLKNAIPALIKDIEHKISKLQQEIHFLQEVQKEIE